MNSSSIALLIFFITTIKGIYHDSFNIFQYFSWNVSSLELDSSSKIDLRIPRYVQAGDSADLVCSYYLDSHSLYSVKWYKGRHEFYRFMPHEIPPVKTFPVKGMKINVS